MDDIFLTWAGDLSVGSTGDLALVAGSDMTNQRVCRRLLTNGGDYIWQLDYGGGLARFVGTPADPADIEAVIRTQLSGASGK
jgi:phage baseplate assembly protein W